MKTAYLKPLKESIVACVKIPPSKSYTNRSLLLAALTDSPVTIKNPLVSDDTRSMIECLKELGIEIKEREEEIEVVGSIKDIKNKHFDLNANLSGTTIRFLLALSCIIPGEKKIYGEEGLNKRPMRELVDALKSLGAKIEYLEKEGFPPLLVSSERLSPGVIKIHGDISSQYISALLLVAPLVGDITIEVLGEQISKPYIDMTTDIMKKFGVEINNEDFKKYSIKGKQKYSMSEYSVEGDYSSAGYFFAIAALTKSTITVKNMNPNSKQADRNFLEVLEKMGSEILFSEEEVTFVGHGVRPLEIDMEDCPDQVQTLAVLAAFANGVTKLYGVKSLRIKETERVVALENELNKMRIKTSSSEDSLTIFGGNPKEATINTYGDHRMAMAFSVAGAKIKGMKINDPEVVSKTFPDFFEKLKELGMEITIR